MGNMYSENNNGAKVDPWGTPHEECATEEDYCLIPSILLRGDWIMEMSYHLVQDCMTTLFRLHYITNVTLCVYKANPVLNQGDK